MNATPIPRLPSELFTTTSSTFLKGYEEEERFMNLLNKYGLEKCDTKFLKESPHQSPCCLPYIIYNNDNRQRHAEAGVA